MVMIFLPYLRSCGDHVYQDLFNRGDLFLCVSEHIREKLTRLGCDESKIRVLRLGVDTKDFHVIPSEPKKNNESLRILTVARLVEKKGVAYGIRAVAKTLKKYPQIEYRIVGDGPLKGKLLRLIEELKVTESITLMGWKRKDEVENLLRDSDVFLAPSVTSKGGDEEGIPVAIIEALAQGLPVVSTHHSGIPEVVHDGASGFLVRERDVDSLTEKLHRLIEQPGLRFAMGQEGRKVIEQQYNIDALNDQLDSFYRG